MGGFKDPVRSTRSSHLTYALVLGVGCSGAHACLSQQLPATPSSTAAAVEDFPVLPLPKAPKITCTGNQLTIVAENSTLSAILELLRPCVGVEVHVPSGYTEDRTFAHFGPGTKREVLDSLLASTELNYVIESSATSPDHIVSVFLTARSDGKDAEPAGKPVMPTGDLALTPARRAWLAGLDAVKHGVPLTDTEAQQPSSSEPNVIAGPATHAAPEMHPAGGASEVVTPAAEGGGPGSAAAAGIGAAALASTADLATATGSSAISTATTSDPVSNATQISVAPDSSSPRPDPDTPGNGDPVLQKQINQMQDLFEQRRKMNAAQTKPAAPN